MWKFESGVRSYAPHVGEIPLGMRCMITGSGLLPTVLAQGCSEQADP